MSANITGLWGGLFSWPLVGIHSIITQDGKLLSFGTDLTGAQGSVMYHDLWDPVTGTHTTIDHHMHTPTDIFCANSIIVPGTDHILIAGGDARPLGHVNFGVADVNVFDTTTSLITPDTHGEMAFARWYATAISLTNGQILVMGGRDLAGTPITLPEVYTPGAGWKTLTGANEADASTYYDRAFLNTSGKVVYFTYLSHNVVQLDTAGTGSLTTIGHQPFNMDWESAAIQYAPGKILVSDMDTGLWTVDINGPSALFENVGHFDTERNWANMTVLADGKVLINGGSSVSKSDSHAIKTALLWDPATNALTQMADEDVPRLYHSSAILLPDGTVLSMGGGATNSPNPDFLTRLDAQIFKPTYLFDSSGNLATRPVIVETPDHMQSGTTFTITVDNAADIAKLTFVKSGAATHNFNMNAGFVELGFLQGPDNTLIVTLPDFHQGVTAGSWMLFAWNSAGVPSVAPVLEVDPVFNTGSEVDPENMLTNGSFETAAGVSSARLLDEVVGWHSTRSNFEIWKNGNSGIAANDGATALEMDAGRGTIWQNVHTKSGQSYELSFDYAGRAGFISSSRMEVLWNGVVVATISPASSAFKAFTINVTGTGGNDQLAFRALSTDVDGAGGYLDHVKFRAETLVVNPGLIVNGDMAQPEILFAANWQSFSNGQMQGWQNMGAGSVALARFAGSQMLDLDPTSAADELYQLVQTDAAQTYTLTFDAIATKAKSSTFDVLWNGVVVATVTPGELAMDSFAFSVTGTGGLDKLSFREIGSQSDYLGAYIDNVNMVVETVSLVPPSGPPVSSLAHEGNHVMGDAGNNTLKGTSGMDHIMGLAGNDLLIPYGGDDTVDGGAGVDTMRIAARPAELHVTKNTDGSYDIMTATQTITAIGVEKIALAAGAKSFGTYEIGALLKALATPVNAAHNKANLLANASFESIGSTLAEGAKRAHVTDAAVSGWTSSKTGFEIWHDGYRNQPGSAGHNAVEVDAFDGALTQKVLTQANHIYRLAFDYEGQTGHVASSAMQVVWNGKVIATLRPGDDDIHHQAFSVIGTGGLDALTFRSVAGDTDSHGGLLDNVKLQDFTLTIA